nr:Chain Xi, mL128 [Polytomella magna]8APN_Xi Chain Xi, mL128 [Polytomella magna]8APO_Xi Chain Xi, mL128 [Polytomella magna]
KFQSRAEKKYRIMDEKVGKPRFQA